jgi:hypothetical protein
VVVLGEVGVCRLRREEVLLVDRASDLTQIRLVRLRKRGVVNSWMSASRFAACVITKPRCIGTKGVELREHVCWIVGFQMYSKK